MFEMYCFVFYFCKNERTTNEQQTKYERTTNECKNMIKNVHNSKNKVKLSVKTKLRIKERDMSDLKDYIKNNNAPYATIRKNTGITRDTIVRTIERGWITAQNATKLTDFIKKVRNVQA